MIKIAVDGMGGDFAPQAPVEAAVKLVKEDKSVEVTLFGDENKMGEFLPKELPSNLKIVHTEDFIPMDQKEPAMAVRTNKNSSLVLAMNAVKNKDVDAIVTAGPTGAVISGGLLIVKRLEGVKRPALAPIFPTKIKNKYVTVLDIGANAECTADYLVQFAEIANVYVKEMYGIKSPVVALLNNGTEEGKGREIEKVAFEKLKEHKDINFYGNIEGKTAGDGDVDIIVTDGFSGNVFLKTYEGSAKLISHILKEELKSGVLSTMGALLSKKALGNLKKRLDPNEIGAAVLLGTKAPVFKAHGSSNDYALYNAIKRSKEFVEFDVIEKMRKSINSQKEE